MAFTTLVLFQLFNVFNCRSSVRSAAAGLLENRWLLAGVAVSLLAHLLALYVPVLRTAFHTVALSASDWAVALGIAATLLVGLEIVKALRRARMRPALGA